jgi:DNA-binding MarR family transcriptional regulator
METPERLPEILRKTVLSLIRQDRPDLPPRQLAVLLICCLDASPQTVRGLATQLSIPKTSINRVLERLAQLDLAERRPDPADGRCILITPTPAGATFVAELRTIMTTAAASRSR